MSEDTLRILYVTLIVGFVLWSFWRSFSRSHEPATLLKRWAWTLLLALIGGWITFKFARAGGWAAGFGMPITMAALGVTVGIIWASNWATALAAPLTDLFDGGTAENREVPLYSIAEARRKRGHYQEAVEHVNRQLERFPGDLTGTLLLIDLYAKDLKQMGPAQTALESYLEHGPHHPKNTFLALAHLADAYLTCDSNRKEAQRCLERIQNLCPGTEQEITAAQRLAHLSSDELISERSEAKRIELKQYDRRVGLQTGKPVDLRPTEKSPGELASEYIAQLEKHPLDLEARENLAMLYAESYQRLDMALEQLETMIQFPNQPARNIVKWLNRMADLHIKIDGNIPAAKECLERICTQFPDSAHDSQAAKRIHFLGLEKKGRHS